MTTTPAMKPDDRVRGYATQRGIPLVFPDTYGRLTPAQQRRIRKKENRDAKRTAAAETTP